MNNIKLLLPTLALIYCNTTSAQPIIGISVGKSGYADNPMSYELKGAWKFNQYYSVGISYLDLGSGEINLSYPPEAAIEQHISGFTLFGEAVYPIGSFGLFGKLGAFSWSFERKLSSPNSLPPVYFKDDSSGLNSMFGFGLEWNQTTKISYQLGYDNYRKADKIYIGIKLIVDA